MKFVISVGKYMYVIEGSVGRGCVERSCCWLMLNVYFVFYFIIFGCELVWMLLFMNEKK